MTTRKYNSTTLENKLAVIQYRSEGRSVLDIALIMQMQKSAIYKILKRADFILTQAQESANTECKRIRTERPFNTMLYYWFCTNRAAGKTISGEMLQVKAREFARETKEETFKASNGWLDWWKKRYKISGRRISGEGRTVDIAAVEIWKEEILSDILNTYSPEDIYNCDETAYFYKQNSSRVTLAEQGTRT